MTEHRLQAKVTGTTWTIEGVMLLLMADRVITAADARPLAWGRETGWSHLVEGWLDLLTKLEAGGASADEQGFIKASLLQLAERVCRKADTEPLR